MQATLLGQQGGGGGGVLVKWVDNYFRGTPGPDDGRGRVEWVEKGRGKFRNQRRVY